MYKTLHRSLGLMIIIFTITIKVYSRHLTVLEHQCQKLLSCGRNPWLSFFYQIISVFLNSLRNVE